MKKLMTIGTMSLLLLGSNMAISATSSKDEVKEYEVAQEKTEVTAEVKNVDYKNKKLTLMNDGNSMEVDAKDIQNLKEIKKGDMVTATFQEALAYKLNKGGKAEAAKVSESAQGGKPGEKPKGTYEREITATVIITKIDKNEPSVTIKNAKGDTQTIKVAHPERLNDVKVGDAVDITYSQALALKVEKKGTKQSQEE